MLHSRRERKKEVQRFYNQNRVWYSIGIRRLLCMGLSVGLSFSGFVLQVQAESFWLSAGMTGPSGAIQNEADPYLKYQWGLHNYGQLKLEAQKLKKTEIRSADSSAQDAESGMVAAVSGIDIGMEEAWPLYEAKADKRQVIVALIDTGVDLNHTELQNAFWTNTGEIPGDGIDNDGNGYIDDVCGWNFLDGNADVSAAGSQEYHATHVAGSISAAWGNGGIAGIADQKLIKLMPLKVLDSNGFGSEQAVLEAIRYAEANGASICNLSLGGTNHSAELEAAIRDSGMLFVAAAGNGGTGGIGYSIDQTPLYPASWSCSNLLTVANLGFDGKLHTSSNYGMESVDLAAPGSYILSSIPGDQYAFLTGTSMAVPMVTAAAAMVYSYRTDLTLDEIVPLLLRTVRRLDSLEGLVKSGGMLNVYQALIDESQQTEGKQN